MDIDIIGTPDEEAMGCKVDMCNAGVFKDYDFAIMVHLDGEETRPNSQFLALDCFRAKFHGKPGPCSRRALERRQCGKRRTTRYSCYGYDASTSAP